MSDDVRLEQRDLDFFYVLTNDVPDREVGTGCMPRFMSNHRARKLWRAGYVTGEQHHFRGGWPGIRYSIAEKGRLAAVAALKAKFPSQEISGELATPVRWP